MTNPSFEVRYKGKQLRKGFFGTIVKELPVKLRAPVLKHYAEFMIEKWKPYPRYKWVTRRAAYGKSFVSAKQRRFVMASLRAGRNLKTGSPMEPGYPHRTGSVQRGWEIQGKGVNIAIVNTSPIAPYLYSPIYQARQPAGVGWQNTDVLIEDNKVKAIVDVTKFIAEIAPDIVDKILLGA